MRCKMPRVRCARAMNDLTTFLQTLRKDYKIAIAANRRSWRNPEQIKTHGSEEIAPPFFEHGSAHASIATWLMKVVTYFLQIFITAYLSLVRRCNIRISKK